jgi:hypothetical protein
LLFILNCGKFEHSGPLVEPKTGYFLGKFETNFL